MAGADIILVWQTSSDAVKTITFSNFIAGITGGGGGVPGGLPSQVQFNNAGAFGGITNATTDGTTLTLTNPVITGPTGLTKSDVGLSNVDNTSDLNKPVSTATTTALSLKANIDSPTFTGAPSAPTAIVGTNSTQLATTAFVASAIASAPNGTVGTGTANQMAFYSTSGATVVGTSAITVDAATTNVAFATNARSSGIANYLKITTPSDTGITAATEGIGIRLMPGTRTWATTGTVAVQREIFFSGPTYASASASQTFTDVYTMMISQPIQGTNAIFTRAHTLGIYDSTASSSPITGGLMVMTNAGVAATSVGIGGGNIYAGGAIYSTGATSGIGYATGAGGAVTQLTNRTTSVTLNTMSGDITLFSAAGSATPTTFTLTNSNIGANDTISVVQKSGTDIYEIFVSNTSAGGSCKITFFTTGGTTTEQPVFHFNIHKGANA